MNKNKSFTLIELLVVIVIIGILAGVIMISTSSSIDKANFAKTQAFSSTVQNELLSNLVSEWTFDEPEEGNITKDSWGNNHGTVNGAQYKDKTTRECFLRGCYMFDGVDDYIEIADSPEMRMTQGGTIAVWIYPRTMGEVSGRIIDKSTTTSSTNGFMFYLSYKDKLSLGIESARIHSPNDTIILNAWNFVVATITNSKKHLYVNGMVATASGENSTVLPSNVAGVIRIGNRAGATDRTFDGLIDDVRIYNAALSSAQIKQNYIAGLNSLLANGNISKEDYNERINNLAYEQE